MIKMANLKKSLSLVVVVVPDPETLHRAFGTQALQNLCK